MANIIQKVINFIYRYPKSKLAIYRKFGGYFDYCKMIRSRKLMERAAYKLPPVKSDPNGLSIYFLTGKNYLYQTLFCIQSLNQCTSANFNYVLVDDGTFNDKLIPQIGQLLPGAEIITKEIIEQNLNQTLPQNKFPILHRKRKEYPHIKKLTDIHTIPGSWKLVLDSDMLFWKEPTEMIDWLKNPLSPLHMIDCEQSYGYSDHIMTQLKGNKIPELINVGILGLKSEIIDWDKVEKWIGILEQQEGKTYYLEQALSAMLISAQHPTALNKLDYIVNPLKDKIINKEGVLHHYVDLSKEGYFKQAWRDIINFN